MFRTTSDSGISLASTISPKLEDSGGEGKSALLTYFIPCSSSLMSKIPSDVTSILCREFSVAIPVSDRLFTFPATENASISPSFLKGVIPGHGALEKCAPVFPCTPAPDEKPSAFKWFLPPFTLAAFKIFSLSLILSSVIMPCFGMVFFGFLLGVHPASSICGLKSLAIF